MILKNIKTGQKWIVTVVKVKQLTVIIKFNFAGDESQKIRRHIFFV